MPSNLERRLALLNDETRKKIIGGKMSRAKGSGDTEEAAGLLQEVKTSPVHLQGSSGDGVSPPEHPPLLFVQARGSSSLHPH